MTGKSLDISSRQAELQPSGDESRLAIAEVLTLPEPLQSLMGWIVRQEAVSLSEIVAYTGDDEETLLSKLAALQQEGFIQAIEQSGKTLYQRTRFAPKRGKQGSEKIWQSLAPGSPLAIIRNPSGDQMVVAGAVDPVELYVTISNQGNQSAVVDIYIDEVCQPVWQWCKAPRDRLALGPKQSGEVVFEFYVPPQALPGTYDYTLVVDAPQHYPEDTPIQHTQRLQVLPPIQDAVRVNDPTFALRPATSSAKPIALQPPQPLEVMVLVDNRSDRVDRFRLTCKDLPDSWFTIRYPEGLDTPGLVTEADGLALNPGVQGQILLLIHPPLDALAGTYSPTIRLHSANNPELVLLDLVYFQVPAFYSLLVTVSTLRSRVKRGLGQYELRLVNDGNTERTVLVSVISADEEDLCVYTLEPIQTEWILPPKTASTIDLRVEPVKCWKRPLLGGGRPLNFFVVVEDRQQLPLLPGDRLQGTLVWESRPWWHLLLLALTTLGTLAALIFLIWWVFFRPPAVPKILEFSSASSVYQEAEGDFVQLNWQIRHADQLETIQITGQSPDGVATSKPIVYRFSQGIPSDLKGACTVQPLQQLLTCKGVRTDARKAGNYIFELAVMSKRGKEGPVDSRKTSTISIQPPAPQIAYFRIDGKDIAVNSKYLVPINPKNPIKQLMLSWQVEGGNDLKVELLPAPGNVPQRSTIAYPLTQKPSIETFTLKVSNAAGEISRSIMIESFAPPAIPGKLPTPPNLVTMPGSPLLPPSPNVPVVPIPAPATLSPPPSLGPPASSGAAPGGQPSGASPSGSTGAGTAPSTPPNPNAPVPTDPNSLSPTELPPKFD